MEKAAAEKIWSNMCRVVLGGEVGPVDDYIPYLQKYVPQGRIAKSAISGKELLTNSAYPESARFISADEASAAAKLANGAIPAKGSGIAAKDSAAPAKIAPLDINSIKDIDSLLEALREQLHYSGNIVLGNSAELFLSNGVFNSSNVYCSQYVLNSKNVLYCTYVRFQENVAGSENVGGKKSGNCVIKGFRIYWGTRVLEATSSNTIADCYYVGNLYNCSDCLFSFNLNSKKRCIGNRELPADKFAALKTKLLSEIRETLRAKRDLPSIIDIIREGGRDGAD